jgi:crotonobetainyl-CoA:carnitine CoA-transferase CaiB-like acyl-CoA transferase
MAATMLSVNERAGSLWSGIDTNGEPLVLSANDSHIFRLPDGNRLTIAASPILSPMFARYCAMMRRNDLLSDPRYATANLRREHLSSLLEEVRVWILTFTDLQQLQAQISEAGLACGMLRTVDEFAKSDWVKEWGAIVDVDDRSGGTARMPGNPWLFSRSTLPPPGVPAFQGEHNEEILAENNVPPDRIKDMQARKILLSRRNPLGGYD